MTLRQDWQVGVGRDRKFGIQAKIKEAERKRWKEWKNIKRQPRKHIRKKLTHKDGGKPKADNKGRK